MKLEHIALSVLQSIQELIYIRDLESNIVYINKAAEQFTGYNLAEAKGKKCYAIFGDEDLSCKRTCPVEKAIADQISLTHNEGRLKTKFGENRYLSVSISPVWEKEAITGAVVVMQDLTLLKEKEQTQVKILLEKELYINELTQTKNDLQQSEEKFRQVVENANEGIFVIQDGVYKYVNDYGLNLFGRKWNELVGAAILQDVHPDDREWPMERIQRRLAGKTVEDIVEHRIIDARGQVKWVETRGVQSTWEGRPASIGFATDITDRKRAEKEKFDLFKQLQESEQRFRKYFEEIPSGAYISAPDGQLLECNQEYVNMFGFPSRQEALDTSVVSLYEPPERRQEFLEAVSEQKGMKRFESHMHKIDGTPLYVIENAVGFFDKEGVLASIRGYLLDITEQRNLEHQLRQSQKMEAIGTLTGDIAHDFNKILGIILGYTEIALSEIPTANPVQKSLQEVKTASLRARDVVAQLLTFTRRQQQEPTILDIRSIIKEALKQLRSTIPTSIEFQTVFPETISPIKADATQMHQVLMNLCNNAAQAMPEGGILKLKLEQLAFDRKGASFDPNLVPGDYVKLSLSDSGQGISAEDLPRIFDPYFTTKDIGQGSGLGLSVVLGIVKSHGGGIRVQSEVNRGSSFEIYLPVAKKNLERSEPKPHQELPMGSERILIIDDEESIVKLNRKRLEHLGYTVTGTSAALKALELIRQNAAQYDLVITDMTMPKMTGDRLAREMLEIRPDLPIILCTGHSDKISRESSKELGLAKYLEKPLEMQTLALSVREVLDRQ